MDLTTQEPSCFVLSDLDVGKNWSGADRLSRHTRRSLDGTARSILSLTPTPSSSTPAAAVLPHVEVKPDGAAGAQVLDFDDTQRLFATVPSRTLLRSVAVMCAMGCEPVMDLGIAVMRSRVLERSRMARAVVMAAAKETVYRHFCAGEGVEEAGRTLQGLWDEGVRGILDYSLEDAVDNAGCDANLAEFVKTVETTSLLPPSSCSQSFGSGYISDVEGPGPANGVVSAAASTTDGGRSAANRNAGKEKKKQSKSKKTRGNHE